MALGNHDGDESISKNNENIHDVERRHKARSRLVLPGGAALLGLFLSFLLYGYFYSISKNFIIQEYDYSADVTFYAFMNRLDVLEISLGKVAAEDEKTAARIQGFQRGELKRLYSASMNSFGKVTLAELHAYTTDQNQYVVPEVSANTFQKAMKSNVADFIDGQLVFMVRDAAALRRGQNKVVVAVVDLSSIFHDGWMDKRHYLEKISLFRAQNLTPLWEIQSKDASKEQDFAKSYEINFAQNKWDVKIVFKQDRFLDFLLLIPLFLFLAGICITGVLVMFLWQRQKHDAQEKQNEKDLENKHIELENEALKRDNLLQVMQQSEKENRAIIDAVSDIIFETNTQGEILFLSAAWHKVTGFDPEQFVGNELFTLLHPQDQEIQKKDFDLLVKGQKQAYRSFTRLRTSNGNFRAVELAVSMMRQDKNKNLRVVGTFTDVEERRRAERALSEAEKKFRAIVENAAGGIYQMTPEGIYLSANPAMARILRYDSSDKILREVKNANLTVYANPKERLQFLTKIQKCDEYLNHETQLKCQDGEVIWVNENVRVVRDDSGNTLYFEGSIEDITTRKQSEIALNEAKINSDLANRAKSEFLANMSHELRTPLNSIIGFSEMIKNEVMGKIEQRSYWEYAKDIHESGKALLTVINEILDISKIDAGNRQLNEGVVDLTSTVSGCLDLLSRKIENNKMHVINALENVPKIIGEELAIKQIFMNIISNAIKFTPSEGRVTITYEVDNSGQLRVSVTDTGVGLDDVELEKALSPFGQVNSDLNRSGSGTGLGLTLVDSLIRLHDGRLEVLSQKGLGTTVTVIFPVERLMVQTEIDNPARNANKKRPLAAEVPLAASTTEMATEVVDGAEDPQADHGEQNEALGDHAVLDDDLHGSSEEDLL